MHSRMSAELIVFVWKHLADCKIALAEKWCNVEYHVNCHVNVSMLISSWPDNSTAVLVGMPVLGAAELGVCVKECILDHAVISSCGLHCSSNLIALST